MPAVAKAAREDADPAVRVACINTLRELGGLADLTAAGGNPGEKHDRRKRPRPRKRRWPRFAAGKPIRAACAEKLIAGLAAAQPAQKCALLRILRSVVDAKSLQAIRAAMADANTEVQETATRLICDWSTVEAAPDLLALAKTSPNPTYKLLALRGYLRVSGDKDVTADQRLAMCKEAAALVQRDEETEDFVRCPGRCRGCGIAGDGGGASG